MASTLDDLIKEAFSNVEHAHYCIKNTEENPKGPDILGQLGSALNLLKTASNILDRNKKLNVDVLDQDDQFIKDKEGW